MTNFFMWFVVEKSVEKRKPCLIFPRISCHISSMRNKIHQIFPFLTDNQTDILFVQETWIRKCDGAILKEIKEYGFDILSYRKPCQLDWGRGVATVFKHNLKIKLIKLSLYQSFEYITCKIISDDGPVCVVNMYRPEYTPKNPFTVRHFLEEFKTFLEELIIASIPSYYSW